MDYFEEFSTSKSSVSFIFLLSRLKLLRVTATKECFRLDSTLFRTLKTVIWYKHIGGQIYINEWVVEIK